MFLLITIDRLITAFLGALAALTLKIIYDKYVEYNNQIKLRKLIKADLEIQSEKVKFLYTTLKDAKAFLSAEKEIFTVAHYNPISLNVYKAYSERDYFSAFDEHEFKLLMNIYTSLNFLANFDNHKLFNEYKSGIDGLQVGEQIEDLNTVYQNEIDSLLDEIEYAFGNMDEFYNIYMTKYNMEIY